MAKKQQKDKNHFSKIPIIPLALIALLFCAGAEASKYLSSYFNSDIFIWFPAGIALSGIIFYGYIALIPILLGAFLVYYHDFAPLIYVELSAVEIIAYIVTAFILYKKTNILNIKTIYTIFAVIVLATLLLSAGNLFVLWSNYLINESELISKAIRLIAANFLGILSIAPFAILIKYLSPKDTHESGNKNDFMKTLIQQFPIPMFYKERNKNSFFTNDAFNLLAGENRQNILKDLSDMTTTKLENKFELQFKTDNDREKNTIVYLSKDSQNDYNITGIVFDITNEINAKNTIKNLKDRYELATNGSNEGLWDWDLKTNEVFFSNSWQEIMGYANHPAKPDIQSWISLILQQDKSSVLKELEKHINNKTSSFQNEHRVKTVNGLEKWIFVRGKAVYNKNNEPIRIVGFTTDITDMKEAQLALRDSEMQFKLFMKNLPAGAFIKDPDNTFIYANSYLNKFFNLNTLQGKKAPDFLPEQLAKNILTKDRESFEKESSLDEEKYTDHTGKEFIFQTHRFTFTKNNQKLLGGVSVDITDHKKSQAKLDFLAHYDMLTTLPNRVLFQDRLSHALSKAKRAKNNMSLMFIDLDNFKTINDTLGHDYGDLLLIEVAKRLNATLRDEDTIARIGGDEFTVILEDVTDTAYPSIVAQKIIDTLSQPIPLKDEIGYIGASIGISIYPDDGADKETLIKNADTAMYKAKEEGKNIYKYFTEDMNAESYEKLTLSNELRNALETNQLVLYYQPIVNTDKNALIAFEALVRWNHPEHGIIQPDKFITIAEESGFMAKVGKWIIKQACMQIKMMQDFGLNIKVAVNISSKQLTQNHLEQTVKDIVKETGIDARDLELEVTESFLMENLQKVEKTLTNLKSIGIKTAIDDFGTGYSSLSYLKKLPISKLKIDKSFIDDIPHDKDDTQIASTIISMGQQLSLEVVAEGVETQAQVDFLKSQKCFIMQGFYFSEAVPEPELNDFITKYLTG